jgi:uncharacterized protein YggE
LARVKDGITVSGRGQASAPPDQAAINLGVTAVRPDAAAALAEVGSKIERLIDMLAGLGVDREALTTADLSLWEETDSNGAPAGYRARNTLRIDTEPVRIGEILQAGLASLGTGAEMNGISFSLKNHAATSAEARDRAFDAAHAKAAQLASRADRSLGPVISIVEDEGILGESRAMRLASAESVPVVGGSTTVTVNLTVRFALVG